ncbi:MAG: MBL fold metallo-hydrolase [Thermoanaerobaculia bacterium]|nr:MBL fold metallo-hydrolase [Thermoanaerobaculia bacterium]
MKHPSLIILLLSVMTLPLAAQNDLSEVEIKAEKVAGTVYILTGAGGNLGASVGEDGIILIDDQYAPLAPKIRAALAEIADAEVLYVLNTHWHGDHTGGNEYFGEIAPVVSHHNVRKRLAEGMDRGGRTIEPAPEEALPVLTFGDDLILHYNGEAIHAIHLPHGHTDGDIAILFPESNVIHMGDHYFQGRFPFIDLQSGGSVRGMIRNIRNVLEILPADARVIPGHGDLSNASELKEHLEMLKATSRVVRDALDEGKTLDQMKEEKILKEWEDLSWGFISTDRYLETLVEDLSKPETHHRRHHHGEKSHQHRHHEGD